MSLNIELKDAKAAYRPGESVEGEACWTLDPAPPALVVRLCWRTEAPGCSTSDRVTAVEQRIENPVAGHAHQGFSLRVPDGPWSFAGALFAIHWFVRLEDGEGRVEEADVVVSPTGHAVEAPGGEAGRAAGG